MLTNLQEFPEIPGLFRGEIIGNRVGGFDPRGTFYDAFIQSEFREIAGKELLTQQMNFVINNLGAIRGFHAENWDKLVCAANGRMQVAYVDCRDHEHFGNVVTFSVDVPSVIFVPAGVANSYLALTDQLVYIYQATSEWNADAPYPLFNLYDPELQVPWDTTYPHILSDKDKTHPPLRGAFPEAWQAWRGGAKE
ncbi:MAG TPA: dTDP-4-dehydrorhamnose 3,5-epimerase family protein [Verrucomicrobiae bacterium]|nr:dTDP-4-dehydrorhamnose 3,5-epimerase family protein [Verrucomicrobiae bacterium]